jgi:hypothetical protein
MLFVYLPFMLFDGFLNVLGQSHRVTVSSTSQMLEREGSKPAATIRNSSYHVVDRRA